MPLNSLSSRRVAQLVLGFNLLPIQILKVEFVTFEILGFNLLYPQKLQGINCNFSILYYINVFTLISVLIGFLLID